MTYAPHAPAEALPYPAGGFERFPVLRSVLREDLLAYDDFQLVEIAAQMAPGTDLEALEFSLNDIGKALKSAGGVVLKAAPGAISGAMSGATLGSGFGPYGMAAGAILGALGGGISSYAQSQNHPATAPQQHPRPTAPAHPGLARPPISTQRPAAHNPPAVARAQTRRAPQAPTPQQRLGQIAGSVLQPTAQILQVLARPEVIQAILALSAGALGRKTVPVGNQNLLTAAVAEAVQYAAARTGPFVLDEEAIGAGGGFAYEALLATPRPMNHPIDMLFPDHATASPYSNVGHAPDPNHF